MWPKAIAQLIELLPHMSRLLPLADRFLNSKTADAEASRTAMEQMAAGLRGDLGQVTASHAGLYRQLNEQSERLGNIAAETHATQLIVSALDAELEATQARLRTALILGSITLASTLILGIVIIVLLLRHA